MSSRPDPYAPSTPTDPGDPVAPAAPVNPGAWDTRSWTLVEAPDDPPAESGPEPLGAHPVDRGDAAEVVWPEAGRTDAPALDADGVPLAEPPTGPLRSVARQAEAPAPGPLGDQRPPRPAPQPERGIPDAAAPPRRRASATPRTAPRPGPPAPETRLPDPAPASASGSARTSPEPAAAGARGPGEDRKEGGGPGRTGDDGAAATARGPRRRGRATTPAPGADAPDPAASAGPRPAPPTPAGDVPFPDAEPDEPRGRGLARWRRGSARRAAADIAERDAPSVPGSRVPFGDDDRGRADAAPAGRGPQSAPRGGRRGARPRDVQTSPSAGTAASDGPRQRPPTPFADGRQEERREPTGRRETPAASRTERARPAGEAVAPGASADPVRALMHQHRVLCERAVDPLEIAAGLEAHGITDRTAARYRHRDVFSLAEELYVRVPRAESTGPAADPDTAAGARKGGGLRTVGSGLSHLLPGALCAATLVGLQYVPQDPPYARPAVGALGALTVLAAVGLSLRTVPRTRTAGLWACWLLGYVLYGDWLLTQLLAGGARAERLLPALGCLCVPLAMSFGVAPAAWCAHLFATRARRRLAGCRSLGDFAAGVRPLLLLTVALFTAALLAVQAAAHVIVEGAAPPHATQVATAALGLLLFVALLLSAHGFSRAASAGLAAACLMVAAVLGTVLAARLPQAQRLADPVEAAVTTYGPTVVPIAACALAALPLLGYALRVLTGASAHQRSGPHPGRPPQRVR